MFRQIKEEERNILSARLRDKRDVFIKKYFRMLKLNSIQFTHGKKGAGRNYALKPSGTNRGVSRLPRVKIPRRGLVCKGRPNTVGGPRSYHDRLTKRILYMNKKQKKLAHQQIILDSLLYSKTYIVNDIQLLNRKKVIDCSKQLVEDRYNQKTKKSRGFKKFAVLLYKEGSTSQQTKLYKTYKNTCLDLVNLTNPYLLPLQFSGNTSDNKHIILIPQTLYTTILNEKI